MIDGEGDDAEHQMAFDLYGATHANESGSEFVLQTGVDSFGHGAEIMGDVVGVGEVDELSALDFLGPFGLEFSLGAVVGIDDGDVAEGLAAVMNGGGVPQIVEIVDALSSHGHQGNGDLTVRTEAEVSTRETGIWPLATSICSL